jgi:hypothetical protein
MKSLRIRSLACVIVWICLAVGAGVSLAAVPNAPKGEVTPAIKSRVEAALRVLGEEIVRQAPVDDTSAFALLRSYLDQNPDIYGAAFAFAPAKKNDRLLKSAPYVYRSGGEFIAQTGSGSLTQGQAPSRVQKRPCRSALRQDRQPTVV